MKSILRFSGMICFAVFGLAACHSQVGNGGRYHGRIVLGDSATIVTEHDSAYLKDKVADINPRQFIQSAIASSQKDTDKSSGKKSNPTKASTSVTPSHSGFTIDFGKNVTAFFPGIATREFSRQNPVHDAGVSYAITSGNIKKSEIKVTGLTALKIQIRYQTYLVLESGNSKLSLQNMGGYLSDWKDMALEKKGDIGIGKFSDLQRLKFKRVSHSTIRRYARRAARSSRMSRHSTNLWLRRIRKTRSANDAPCVIKLDNVQFKIYGQTKDGHSFFKAIRLDN